MNRTGRTVVRAFALLAVIAFSVRATPDWNEQETSLRGKHIDFSITSSGLSGGDSLYYKSLLENLDGLADSLKQAGKLSRGKVRFKLLKETWNQYDKNAVDMYRDKNGYYCLLNAFYQDITQDYMAKIIAYFASDGWESFSYDGCGCGDEKIHRRAIKNFNRRIDPVTAPPAPASRKPDVGADKQDQ